MSRNRESERRFDVGAEMLRGGTTAAGENGMCGSCYPITLKLHSHIAQSRAAGADKVSQLTILDVHHIAEQQNRPLMMRRRSFTI